MRDGTKLYAVALAPRGATSLPIILVRTPFGAANAIRSDAVPGQFKELAQDGYIFVVEDIRGRLGSEGTFVVNRAQDDPRSPRGINESTDSWDTIDWLVKNLPGNSGKVGVLGMSYPGWLAALTGVQPHPALKAISPQAPMADAWMGDDFFHQGAFRLTQGVVFSKLVEDPNGFTFLSVPDYDHYDFYLRYSTLGMLARAVGIDTVPLWRDFVAHPSWDGYWQAKSLKNVWTHSTVPTLVVGGFWDQEDILGPQLIWRTLEKTDSSRFNRLVLGPWSHGQWLRPGGDSLGPLQFGSPTADWFRAEVLRPWFAWYLHGKGNGDFPEVRAYETGANAWRTFDTWPPRQVETRRLYLAANGALSWKAPVKTPPAAVADSVHTADFDSYISDPAHPVPYLPRPDDETGWDTWLLRDQRFVDNRPDVLTWRSEPLEQDLTIAGGVLARLVASTTGTDADWVVKLIDVYPDSVAERPELGGYQLMVNADIMRGRYWKDFTTPRAIPRNIPTTFTVDLHDQLYRFRKGHRIMVQVQSTWFPLYDRNPQRFVPNIFLAEPIDYRAARHRVWHSPRYASYIELPVLP